MGWIKTPVKTNEEIFNEIVSARPEWNGIPDDSTSPYEYWGDWIRDYYDVTIKQCDEICTMLKEYYGIKEFYYTEMECYKTL